MRKHYIAMLLVVLLGAGSVIAHYVLTKERNKDHETLRDLGALRDRIDIYVENKRKLPSNLQALDLDNLRVEKNLDKYDYRILSENEEGAYSYELCAHFNKESKGRPYSYGSNDYIDASSPHPAGYHCFKQQTHIYR